MCSGGSPACHFGVECLVHAERGHHHWVKVCVMQTCLEEYECLLLLQMCSVMWRDPVVPQCFCTVQYIS